MQSHAKYKQLHENGVFQNKTNLSKQNRILKNDYAKQIVAGRVLTKNMFKYIS